MRNLLKDKQGVEFKLVFFALIAISLVTIATGNWVTEWSRAYQSNISYDINELNELEALSAEAEAQKGNIGISSTSASDSGDFEGTSIKGIFGIINNIFAPFRIIFGEDGMIGSMEKRLGIPSYISIGVISLIIFTIIFALGAIIFRRAKQSM